MNKLIGTKVFVYYNLHKHVFSIKAMEGDRKGRVVGYSTHITLSDAIPKVSEAGRQRVIRERKKNVHAGIVGIVESLGDMGVQAGQSVTYNPYKFSTFVLTGCLTPAPNGVRYYLHQKRITLLGDN